MRKINEEFLQFLWKNQHLTGVKLHSLDKYRVEVLDPGQQNFDAGPDFLNARVKIDGTMWAGNVELHINASDWLKHGHQNNPLYNSVILHIVVFNDCVITGAGGRPIPTIVLRFPTILWETYNSMMKNEAWIPCQEKLHGLSGLTISQWTSSLIVEKLQTWNDTLERNFIDVSQHWDALLSRLLFRSFGIPVNTTPFEMLSLALPYTVLLREKNELFGLEARLFGQAGMLNTVIAPDKYTEALMLRFKKHALTTDQPILPGHIWKFMRMRPSAFPSLRLAQLAAVIHYLFPLHQVLMKMPKLETLYKTFRIKGSDYWNTHFQLGKESAFRCKYLGQDFIQVLITNCIVPYLFFYGKKRNVPEYCDYSLAILEELPAEKNAILKKWGKFGVSCSSALESQALLQLYKHYCKHKLCLKCQFGNTLIINDKKTK